jgi:hypothetical protein
MFFSQNSLWVGLVETYVSSFVTSFANDVTSEDYFSSAKPWPRLRWGSLFAKKNKKTELSL